MANPYCFVCVACNHPLHDHLRVPDEDRASELYRCTVCGCEVPPDAPWIGWTAAQFAEYKMGAGTTE